MAARLHGPWIPCLFSPWPQLCDSLYIVVISASPPDVLAFAQASEAGRHLQDMERDQSESPAAGFQCLFIYSKPEACKEICFQLHSGAVALPEIPMWLLLLWL